VDLVDPLVAAAAGFVAGGVNALAGGGTLVSFPVLLALGLPAVSANVTNTVALSPGYLGGALSQRAALREQRARLPRLLIGAAAGGVAGSLLLLFTSDEAFETLIPVLLLAATLLLAGQDRLRRALRLPDAPPPGTTARDPGWVVVPVVAVSVYGGYFGAGLGIMLLAVLGLVLHDPLDRLNALKQVLALVINATATVLFLFSGRVHWWIALAMAVASLVGGNLGGRLAGSVQPARLRLIVVVIGLAVAAVYAVRLWV
jgi:uncharacterized membrane protein YfcA